MREQEQEEKRRREREKGEKRKMERIELTRKTHLFSLDESVKLNAQIFFSFSD